MLLAVTLNDQHREWHQVHGKHQTCPLDCGAGEIVAETFEKDRLALESGSIRIHCGCCKHVHSSVEMVKFCHEVQWDSETFARRETAMAKEIEEAGECEHGLSAALCAGAGHYPMDL